jgi:spore germination protein KB
MEKGRITNRQFSGLIIMFTLGSSSMILPQYLISIAKQDAWISALLTSVLAVFLVSFYTIVGKRYPNKTIIEYSQTILGRWLGSALGIVYLFYFLTLTSGLLRQAGDFITTEIMPETPIQALIILILFVVVMAVRLGLEVFARMSEVFMPWVFMLFAILTISLLSQIEIRNLQPILVDGIKPVIKGTYLMLGIPFLDFIVMLMVFPYVKEKKKINKTWIIATIIGSIIVLLIMLLNVLVLGANIATTEMYPTYALGKKVSIGNFLERIELVVAVIWMISLFVKACIAFYATCLCLAQLIKLNDKNTITLPLAMITVPLSLILVPNIIEFNALIMDIWAPFMITIGFIFPLILLLVDLLKSKITNSS